MKNFLLQHRTWITIMTVTVVGLSIYTGLSYLFGPKNSKIFDFGIESAASVTRVEPLPNTIKIGAVPDFVVYFDLDVKAEQAKLKAEPELKFEKSNLKKNRVLFRPTESLKANTSYILTVEVASKDKFNWKITTKSYSVDKDYAKSVNKVKKALPYKTGNFRVAYDPPTDKYFAYMSSQQMTKHLEEVKQWFASFGVVDTTPLNLGTFS